MIRLRYRKIEMQNFYVVTDSEKDDSLLDIKFPCEVGFLNYIAKEGWELITIVDNHKTFIFKKNLI
jgi:hypothetical protein